MILQTNAVEIYISNMHIHRFESIRKCESYSLTKNIYIIPNKYFDTYANDDSCSSAICQAFQPEIVT